MALSGLMAFGLIAGLWSTKAYWSYDFSLKSPAREPLRIFYYNQSTLPDPVAGCWYDSGDYVVFLNRNALSFYYLSLAYKEAKEASVKNDIANLLASQESCFEPLLANGYKQFGDQASHGLNLPPAWHSIFFQRRFFPLKPDEGKDIFLLLQLAWENLGQPERAAVWGQAATTRSEPMITENCCEEGPLFLAEKELSALTLLAGQSTVVVEPWWGLSLQNLALLQKRPQAIAAFLTDVAKQWRGHNGQPFHYLGGNYDIAGTIALERLYARKTGDNSFFDLSQSMYEYLHGNNSFKLSFANFKRPYHPCGFWGMCQLKETLINGVDESGVFDKRRGDLWRLTEVQLTGQSIYVLAYVLYNDF